MRPRDPDALPVRGDGTSPPGGPAAAARAHAAAARRAPAEALALRRRLRARADALRGDARGSAGIPQAFWAVLDRASRRARGPHGVHAAAASRSATARLSVRGRGVEIDLALQPAGEPVEVVSPHGDSFIWTRKDPVRATGARDGRRAARYEIDARRA